jgi:hypothetical protein
MPAVCAALQKPAVAKIGRDAAPASRAARRTAVRVTAMKQEQKVRPE